MLYLIFFGRKPSHAKEQEKTVFEKLYEANRESVTNLVKDLFSQFPVRAVVEKTFQNATEAKEKVDQNMEALLALLNIPSNADYEYLLTKVEEVQGNLVNVSMKLDRLLAKRQKPRKRSTAKRKTRSVQE